MNKEKRIEFLTKLANLLDEYNVEIEFTLCNHENKNNYKEKI